MRFKHYSVWPQRFVLSAALCVFSLALTLPVLAAPGDDFYGLNTTAVNAGLDADPNRDLPTIIGQAVNYLFGALGVVFLTVSLVSGYIWMTAGGNEEKVKQAKGFIINGINGMILIFISYALVYLIIAALRGTNGGA